MITLEEIDAALPFAVFRGDAVDPGPVPWCIVDLDGYTTLGSHEAAAAVTGLSVVEAEPERDDEACAASSALNSRGLPFDDCDAWLAFLRAGGTLCKVPDHEGSAHYRLLVVQQSVP